MLAANAEVDAIVAYQTLPPEADGGALARRVASGAISAFAFTSPSTVRHLVDQLDADGRSALSAAIVAAVGPTTARAVRDAGFEPVVVPERAGGPALVAALVDYAGAHPEEVAHLRERQARAAQRTEGDEA